VAGVASAHAAERARCTLQASAHARCSTDKICMHARVAHTACAIKAGAMTCWAWLAGQPLVTAMIDHALLLPSKDVGQGRECREAFALHSYCESAECSVWCCGPGDASRDAPKEVECHTHPLQSECELRVVHGCNVGARD
jgi:hypothetical protein